MSENLLIRKLDPNYFKFSHFNIFELITIGVAVLYGETFRGIV